MQVFPMVLARLASKGLQQRLLVSSAAAACHGVEERTTDGLLQRQRWGIEAVRGFSATGGDKVSDQSSESKEVTVNEGKKSNLFPKKQRRHWLWRNDDREFHPILYEIMPSGLGNALMQATENITRLFRRLNLSPWSMAGRVKEQDEHYKLRFEMPGIAKQDVKVTVEDGILSVSGEHKEEEGGRSGHEDEFWSAASYGYYDTSLVLPDDAKVDEIKAELKDGVLTITIPRTEKPHRDVKEVTVH